ncbi:hypothetical protein A6R68_14517 [Neotoma lepida]|uniref:PIH1 N-terminal domain-containing protein n=1 Tax=Neotoma lepida TaxID=56216 RepID=A0A1A6HBF9_NEOLE|nr:hypothetical protein A6R68_14517 [Neotoma lepida]
MGEGLRRATEFDQDRTSKDVLESLVMLGHMTNKQMEDPATRSALGSRNSLRSLELQQQTEQRKNGFEPRGTVATLDWLITDAQEKVVQRGSEAHFYLWQWAMADLKLLVPELVDTESMSDETVWFQKLLLPASKELWQTQIARPDSMQMQPQPGFCIKTNSSEGKVFINIYHSPSIPPPQWT